MTNITSTLDALYFPKKALLLYECLSDDREIYIESFDIDKQGRPVNAHPLSEAEMNALAECLHHTRQKDRDFLNRPELLPENLLHVQTEPAQRLIWYTPAGEASLLYKKELGIPSGKAKVPSLLWCATSSELRLFAIKTGRRPQQNAPLFHAPFFNMYPDGRVCMGTVDIDLSPDAGIHEWIEQWHAYFYNSYFSHAIAGFITVKENMVELWKRQFQTQEPFPQDLLQPHSLTLKNLLA